MAQVTTFETPYIDVTVWRDDFGRYRVETRKWPEGNGYDELADGSFPEPASHARSLFHRHEWSEYTRDKDEAVKMAEAEFEGRDG